MTPPVPQGSAYGVVPNNAPQSRQQLAQTVALIDKQASSVPIAELGGFAFRMELSKPTPAPSAVPAKKGASAKATPSPSPSPVPSPSPTPTSAASKSKPAASPTPSGPHIDAKVTIYPDGTQKPPGDADSEQAHRVPVVKAVIDASVDVKLYSLAAFEFSIPKTEEEEDRGFTVALYETRKFHKDALIDALMDAKSVDGVVRATGAKEGHTLSKGHTYTVILFGDPLPQTPSPYSPPQYPGTAQYPQSQPQRPQYPGQPVPAQPMPGQPMPPQNPWPTAVPFMTPTPFHY